MHLFATHEVALGFIRELLILVIDCSNGVMVILIASLHLHVPFDL